MHLGSASKGVGLMRKLLLAFATALLIPGMLGAVPFSFFIDPHPDSGEIRGAFAPKNDTQEVSLGAIKSLYR
jgi:hypothetical protein